MELTHAIEASPSWSMHRLRYLWRTTKPTISLLVVVTAIPTLFMAAGANPGPKLVLATLFGLFLASASASAWNHALEQDIDEKMARTKRRPVASGAVSATAVFTFAAILGILSTIILYVFANPLASLLSLSANIFYVVIYTQCLKRYTVQNIVIGGAAGAVGPLVGWAAVTGGLSWEAWAMFAVIFLWTPPHFWALAIKYKDDYKKASIPMLPSVKGVETTRFQIFFYTLTLLPPVIYLSFFTAAGGIFAFAALASTGIFIAMAWKLYRSKNDKSAMPVFHYSCLYLFLIFGALTVDQIAKIWIFA